MRCKPIKRSGQACACARLLSEIWAAGAICDPYFVNFNSFRIIRCPQHQLPAHSRASHIPFGRIRITIAVRSKRIRSRWLGSVLASCNQIKFAFDCFCVFYIFVATLRLPRVNEREPLCVCVRVFECILCTDRRNKKQKKNGREHKICSWNPYDFIFYCCSISISFASAYCHIEEPQARFKCIH